MGSSPVLDQFFFAGFFLLCETFFANFFNVSKGSTLHFFSILHKNGCSKPPKGPLLQFFGTVRLTRDQKISRKKFKVFGFFINFSSRGYCRREYLTLWSPFAIFEPWIRRRLGPFMACYIFSFIITGNRYPFVEKIIAFRHSLFNFVCNPVSSIVLWLDAFFLFEAINTFNYQSLNFLPVLIIPPV